MSTVGSQDDLPGGRTQVEVRRFDRKPEDDWFEDPIDLNRFIESNK